MRRLDATIAALAVALVASSTGSADDSEKTDSEADEIEHVALAARLVTDGHYDRAALTLDRVDLKAPGVDLGLYHVLRGLVSLKRKLYREAAGSFERAIAAGNANPLVHVNLGRARFGARDYRGAVAALERAGEVVESEAGAVELLARAYWEARRPGPALELLARNKRRFPGRIQLARLELMILIKLELFQEVARRRTELLRRADVSARDLTAIGEALRKSGRLAEAGATLEAARLRFPGNRELSVLLARVLLDRGEILSSAMLLEQVSRVHTEFLVESAELYRRAGRLDRALFINQRIADQKAKIKQRLQILLEMERFEMIAAMEIRLSRLGLLADEQIRYALAYGFFMIRDFQAAERHLARLRDPGLFARGIQLREAIEDCRDSGWACR